MGGNYNLIHYIPEWAPQNAPAEEWLKVDPFNYVNQKPVRENARFLLFVGLDTYRLQTAQAFRDVLQAAGYDVSLVQIPGVGHTSMAGGSLNQTVSAIANLMHP